MFLRNSLKQACEMFVTRSLTFSQISTVCNECYEHSSIPIRLPTRPFPSCTSLKSLFDTTANDISTNRSLSTTTFSYGLRAFSAENTIRSAFDFNFSANAPKKNSFLIRSISKDSSSPYKFSMLLYFTTIRRSKSEVAVSASKKALPY